MFDDNAEQRKPKSGPESSDVSLSLLRELYAAHARLQSTRITACGPGCSACCTSRVMMTTAEARLLVNGLLDAGRDDLLSIVRTSPQKDHPLPASTFNALARYCLTKEEPPPDPEPAPVRPCPLLKDDRCAVYEYRPLACRTMSSLNRCAAGGEAIQEPFWVTLDTAFFQLVEHLDAGGGFGPMILAAKKVQGDGAVKLLRCEPLPGLPAPDEHAARLQRALAPVFARPFRGRPLGLWLEDLGRAAE